MAARGYSEQFEHMKRYLARFKKINDGRTHDQTSSNYDDDVYAFFQNCYHLKDWIKKDTSCANWSDVENLVNSNPDFSICADLCNGLKHLTLRTHRSNENPAFGRQEISVKITDGFGVKKKVDIAIRYKVASSTGEMDAVQLAERCVAIWKQFIETNSNR